MPKFTDTFLSLLSGAYIIRAIWNHGHHAGAVGVAAFGILVAICDLLMIFANDEDPEPAGGCAVPRRTCCFYGGEDGKHTSDCDR